MGLSDVWKKQQGGTKPTEEQLRTVEPIKEVVQGRMVGPHIVLDSVLHEGGMGILYLGSHKRTGRKVVVKMIRTEDVGDDTKQLFNRFRREAKGMAQLAHPNIVRILGCDFSNTAEPYIVMEYIEGETLWQVLTKYEKGIPLRTFMLFMSQLCSAFDLIHKKGIVHRDIKPDNIMIERHEGGFRIKILDLGLIIFERALTTTSQLKLTRKGQVVGTPAYMAPEQCKGQEVTYLADIYNLGLVGYELLTGRPAVQGTNPGELFMKQVKEKPPLPHIIRPEVSEKLSRALMRALEKEPADRPQTCLEFFQGLRFAF